jgi:hypothetical protein
VRKEICLLLSVLKCVKSTCTSCTCKLKNIQRKKIEYQQLLVLANHLQPWDDYKCAITTSGKNPNPISAKTIKKNGKEAQDSQSPSALALQNLYLIKVGKTQERNSIIFCCS